MEYSGRLFIWASTFLLKGGVDLSFYGLSIIYDGRPSEEFGLMLADVGSDKQENGKLGGNVSILEDRSVMRHDSFHYGTVQNEALSFPISLVVTEGKRRLDRFDLAAISGWLMWHGQYKELFICQPDMKDVFYRAIVTELEAIEVGGQVVGVKATMTCDAPYAYFRCADTVIAGGPVIYRNRSNINGDYLPRLVFSGVHSMASIVNETTKETFSLSRLSLVEKEILIDCQNGFLSSNNGENLYDGWNEIVPRFVRGDNLISVSGGTLTIKNEFPWSVGY